MRNKVWKITEETYNPKLTKHYEGVFTQGSGYLHIRGSFEEGLICAPQDETYMRMPANVTIEKPRHPRSKCGTYVPGITGNHPLLKEELVNLPNPLCLKVMAEEKLLDMDTCSIKNYRRQLHLRDGLLTRSFLWELPGYLWKRQDSGWSAFRLTERERRISTALWDRANTFAFVMIMPIQIIWQDTR